MMSALQDAQADLDAIEVQGTSGGGVVRVVVNGVPELKRVEISPEALEEPDMLGDLVVAAVNDALRNAQAAAREKMHRLPGLEGLTE
jgi:hypothetical protein